MTSWFKCTYIVCKQRALGLKVVGDKVFGFGLGIIVGVRISSQGQGRLGSVQGSGGPPPTGAQIISIGI
jgi:hypothetical protein